MMSAHTKNYRWLKRLIYTWYLEFKAHETSLTWTQEHCPMCDHAIAAPKARFCISCGARLAPTAVLPGDDVERHTSGIRIPTPAESQQIAQARAHAQQPPTTMTGRFRAYKQQGDRPMNAWQKAKKDQ
jgi:hypothetical protein